MEKIVLKPTYGEFKVLGKIRGKHVDRFYKETTTQTGKPMRRINFAIEFDLGAKIYIQLQGYQNEEVYANLYNKDKAGNKIQDQNGKYLYESIRIPFAQKNTFPSIVNGDASLIGIHTGIQKDAQDKNIKSVLVDFDACAYLDKHLKEGMDVFAIGSVNYYNRNGMTMMQFNLKQIYATTKPIHFEDPDFKPICAIRQSFVYKNIRKVGDQFEVDGVVINKNNVYDVSYIIHNHVLANTFSTHLKPYTLLTATGSLLKTPQKPIEQELEWGKTDPFEFLPVRTEFSILGVNPSSIDAKRYTKASIISYCDQLAEEKRIKEQGFRDSSSKSNITSLQDSSKTKQKKTNESEYAMLEDEHGLSDFEDTLFDDAQWDIED